MEKLSVTTIPADALSALIRSIAIQRALNFSSGRKSNSDTEFVMYFLNLITILSVVATFIERTKCSLKGDSEIHISISSGNCSDSKASDEG